MASKSSSKEKLVLDQNLDLPYKDERLSRRDGKVEAAYAPTMVTATEASTTSMVSAAGGMGIGGGIFNYVAGWFARHALRKITSPVPYDLQVLELDKPALEILEARLDWMTEQECFINRIQSSTFERDEVVYRGLTVREVRDSAVSVYKQLMEGAHPWTMPGEQPSPPSPEEALPGVIQSLELFIKGGGKRKFGKEAETDLEERVRTVTARHHVVKLDIQELSLYEKKRLPDPYDT